MAYLTNELVADAFYVANIVSREFETPTGSQLSTGVMVLNQLLADKTANNSMIPYTEKYELTASPGVSEYFIPNMIYADTFTFYINDVRYQTNNQQRQDYFGSFRATNIQSLPFNWHTERTLNGVNLFLYFVPDQAYPLEIWGQFALASVTQFQDLSLTLDAFYTNFLKYELSIRLCIEYGYNVPPAVQNLYEQYMRWINASANTVDLKMQKMSTLTGGAAINYALVNLSGGWVPI